MNRLLGVIILAIVAAGCGIKAQTYVMTKERVGIENKGGNAGSLMGKNTYQAPAKKTRKVYVLEVSKPVPASEVKKIEQEISIKTAEVNTEPAPVSSAAPAAVVEASTPGPRKIVIPRIDEEPVAVVAPPVKEEGPKETVQYTVLKDDTLQKIAKKFYNSYGKWVRIYDANKDKIKNPNFVKPGTVLTIPAVD